MGSSRSLLDLRRWIPFWVVLCPDGDADHLLMAQAGSRVCPSQKFTGNFGVGRRNCVIQCVSLLNYHETWAEQRARYRSCTPFCSLSLAGCIHRYRRLAVISREGVSKQALGTFRPERIESIASRYGVDGKQALENILVGKALNSESSPPVLPFTSLASLPLCPFPHLGR
jgi:hypothetical protein